MPKRETFQSQLTCSSCGRIGTAKWSENENPVYGRGLDRTLESVSDGFERTQSTDSSGDPVIVCESCGEVANG